VAVPITGYRERKLDRGALAVFGGAVIAALVIGHLLRDTAGYMVRNPDGSVTGDITHYVYWTRLVTLNGVQAAYGGTWPETYAVYPPVNLYAYQTVGTAYRWLQDPTFDPDAAQQSLWLREGIKFVALTWHLLTAAAIFWLVRRIASPMTAATASALYVINPAALYDVAHWAQPDGAHSLFSVLGIGLLGLGGLVAPWAAMAAAAMAKPQAWVLLPLAAVATVRLHSVSALIRGAIVGAVVCVIIALPFIVTSRVDELASLPGVVSSVMPVVSADAHNLWWLVVQSRGQDPLFVQDAARFIGPASFRMVAAVLVGSALLLTYWLYWTRRVGLAEAAALGVLGWFTFTTQVHENHLFFALPLLSLAWPTRRSLLVPFGIVSMTLLMNMLLHDELLLEGLGSGLQDPLVERLRLANAALNVLCCVGWSLLAVLRSPEPATSSDTVRRWPRHNPTQVKVPT
jgi:dolichyl-phosphate-mannose-protein mannosyltransferase